MVNHLLGWTVLLFCVLSVQCQKTYEATKPTNTYLPGPIRVRLAKGKLRGTLKAKKPASKTVKNSYTNKQNCLASKPGSCKSVKYYSLDGRCNNLGQTNWGRAKNPYGRVLPFQYADGKATPTVAYDGNALPNARSLSLLMFGETIDPDERLTLAAMQFGQFVAHDLSHAAGSRQTKPHPVRCCTADGMSLVEGQENNPACFPILIPANDPVISGVCMNLVRSVTDLGRYCKSKADPVEQLSDVTAYLDLSVVYGNSVADLKKLRAFKKGHMIVEHRHKQDFPPHNPKTLTDCDVDNKNDVCYLTGDIRANQSPGLTMHHILFLREHNRLANALAKINPKWKDEQLFQEARKINIAQYQHITYYEWLPRTLGSDNLIEQKLIHINKSGQYVNDYDRGTNAHVVNEFANSAFRYLHNAIRGELELYSETRSQTTVLRLSDHFNRPAILEQATGCKYMSDVIRGHVTEPKKTSDDNIDPEVRHFLFRSGNPTGRDLRAIDIQRARDHGLGRYNDAREFCGFKRATTWDDYLDHIANEDLDKMKSIYTSYEDVDLTIGGSFEEDVEGSVLGPVFQCLAMDQFYRSRVGDRLFYENSPRVSRSGFKIAQLDEIRKASLARLICDNTCGVTKMQTAAFDLVSNENPLVACTNIPRVNMSKWR